MELRRAPVSMVFPIRPALLQPPAGPGRASRRGARRTAASDLPLGWTLTFAATLALLALAPRPGSAQFAGGAGTVDNPYQIANVTQLQSMKDHLDKHFILINDIDASATAQWNDGAGFEPIGRLPFENGDRDRPYIAGFAGHLDGRGHVITGLTIDRPDTHMVGLFGRIASEGSVENLGLEGNVVTGGSHVGGLAGENDNGTVSWCYATGDVTGHAQSVGGLVGINWGTITSSYCAGAVTNMGEWGGAGGLVGGNGGIVSDCFASGDVTGNGGVGGLVGGGYGTIASSYATGAVTGQGEAIGGLSGSLTGTITDCYATGDVRGNMNVGGLVGYSYGSRVLNSYAAGNVTGQENIGGLVGWGSGEVAYCYATGDVSGTQGNIGGLAGLNNREVTYCYATGAVTGDSNVGGLVGHNSDLVATPYHGIVSTCYATGAVTGNAAVGGLVGVNTGRVWASCWDMDTSGHWQSAGGIGLRTRVMLKRHTFERANWNFETIWQIEENLSYPYLQNAPPPSPPTPGLEPTPALLDAYILAYRLRERVYRSDRDVEFSDYVQISDGGITILPGHPDDTLRIVRAPGHRRAYPFSAPTIAYLRAPAGLRVLDSQGPIDVIESNGPVGRMTIRGAVAFVGVGQAQSIRIMAPQRGEPVWTAIQIDAPFQPADRELPTSIQMVGAGLDWLDAPQVLFSQVVSASRVFRDEAGLFVAQGGIGQAGSSVVRARPHRLQAKGGAIRGERFEAPPLSVPWNRLVIGATGATFTLGRPAPGEPIERMVIRGDIEVDSVLMRAAHQVQLHAVGGDIVSGKYGFGSRIQAVRARRMRLGGQWVGGHVGAPDASSDALTVAVLSSPFPGYADIHLISGTDGINGRFVAGAQLGWDNGIIEPTYDGVVRRVEARRADDVFLRGEIHMMSGLPGVRVFRPALRPEVWANNTMTIHTETVY